MLFGVNNQPNNNGVREITYTLPYAKEKFVSKGKYNGVTLRLRGKTDNKFSKYLMISSKGLKDTKENFEKVLQYAIDQGFENSKETDAIFEYSGNIYYVYKKNTKSNANSLLTAEKVNSIIKDSIDTAMKHPEVLGTESDIYKNVIDQNYEKTNMHSGLVECKTEEIFSRCGENNTTTDSTKKDNNDKTDTDKTLTDKTTASTSDKTAAAAKKDTASDATESKEKLYNLNSRYLRYIYPKKGIVRRGVDGFISWIPVVNRLASETPEQPKQNLYFAKKENSTLSHIPSSLLIPRKVEDNKVVSSCFSSPKNVNFELKDGEGNFTYIIERQYLEELEKTDQPFTEEQVQHQESTVLHMLDHAEEISDKIENMFSVCQQALVFDSEYQNQIKKLTKDLKLEAGSKVLWAKGAQKCIIHIIDNKDAKILDYDNITSRKAVKLTNTEKYPTIALSNKKSYSYSNTILEELVHNGISECFKIDQTPKECEFDHTLLDNLEPEFRSSPELMSRADVVQKITKFEANRFPVLNKTVNHSNGKSTQFHLCVKPATGGFIEDKANARFLKKHAQVIGDLLRESTLAIAKKQMAHEINTVTNEYTERMSDYQNLAQGAYSIDLEPIQNLQLDADVELETESQLNKMSTYGYLYKGNIEDQGIPLSFELIVLKET